jgi:hypothetical protein
VNVVIKISIHGHKAPPKRPVAGGLIGKNGLKTTAILKLMRANRAIKSSKQLKQRPDHMLAQQFL